MDDTRAFLAELERIELDAIAENENIVPSGERACPICGNTMEVEQMSGVNIDVCAKHGVWLDRGELPQILDNHVSGTGQRLREQAVAIRKAKHDGKMSHMIFGIWSFLWD